MAFISKKMRSNCGKYIMDVAIYLSLGTIVLYGAIIFLMWPLFRFWGRNLSNFALFFLENLIHQKHSEINWPLITYLSKTSGIFFEILWNSCNTWTLVHKEASVQISFFASKPITWLNLELQGPRFRSFAHFPFGGARTP